MTSTQVTILLLAVLMVAVVAYRLGRGTSATAARGAAPRRASPSAAPASPGAPIHPAEALPTAIRTWGYQLQRPNITTLANSPFDLLVVDYSKDGSDEGAFTPAELTRLKRKPDGRRRLMIAYLSIGEAESYRGYWRPEWTSNKPGWLLSENPDWEENYAVCFWTPAWQAIMYGSPKSRLDRIIAAGFDGVYLDKCDVFDDMRARHMPAADARPDLEADMVAFVTRLSAYAKAKRPDFLVIMQNTENLLDRPSLREVLDGVGKEELVYGVDKPEKKNTRAAIDWSRERLDMMKRDGKLVLVVEYLDNRAKIEDAVNTIERLGYTPYIADKSRELDKLHAPPLIA